MEAEKIQNIKLNIKKLHDLLTKNKYKISSVESCTAGLLSYFLTYFSGSTKFFGESLITYSDEAKIELLNVDRKILDKFTAVSGEVCREMVINFQKMSKSDITVSITGYADHYNNIENNGLMFIGVKIMGEDPIITKNFYYDGRNENRISAVKDTLEIILKHFDSKHFDSKYFGNCA